MSDAMISVENLSKRFVLLRHKAHDRLLSASIISMAKRAVSRPADPDQDADVHWALRNVSFEVAQGEALGIIGRNGAGKSTLLKIISRLTRPTEGRVVTRGRIGSMLEVGVGFNPMLTGRENVMLSGVILGIKRSEIRKKFDDIVEFSGIRPFIDVPVKRYSSGMRVRLAFAVMIMLEPEILLVDEVLSVGDAEFKRRSSARMQELIRGGRTVLFVSHSKQIVEQLCDRALELDRGRLVSIGATSRVVEHYTHATQDDLVGSSNAFKEFEAEASKAMCIRELSVISINGNCSGEIEMAEPLRVRMSYDINEDIQGAHAFCRIETAEGIVVVSSGDADYDPAHLGKRRRGSYTAEFQIDGGLLEAGEYRVSASLGVPYEKNFDRRPDAVQFRVVDRSSRRRLWYPQTRPGLIGREYPWVYEGRAPFA
ncbi:MAG: ABC transporter ATP-binding protein [Phycisphaerales bacterium]|nr:ABC transporter ATP-binding protein [Phycisphaerales bacterium]